MPLLRLVPDNTNIDFMRWRGFAIVVSLLLLAASAFFLTTRGLNFGVDFVGGQLQRVTLSQTVPLGDIRDRVGQIGHGDAVVTTTGSDRELAIRLPHPDDDSPAAANKAAADVQAAVRALDPKARFDTVETVSGRVSEELLQTGAISLALAMLGIALYIWFRFEWQFGVGALVSLAHDMTIVLGFYAATQLTFDLNAVAALLTLIGFSLNDTVVVYDRVRENLRKYRKMGIEELLNLSVNETLARTVATNSCVALAVITLVLIGPDTIDSLSYGILAGVIIGTYSSIYVARFLLVPLGVGPDSFRPNNDRNPDAERVTRREGSI